jgi:hypothetical protein
MAFGIIKRVELEPVKIRDYAWFEGPTSPNLLMPTSIIGHRGAS